VRAVYVYHQLHVESGQWAKHCESQAKALGIPFKVLTVSVTQTNTLGIEAAARQARYTALNTDLHTNEVLLTAQHAEDQTETVLLQLLRGAGPAGLAAMGEVSHWQDMPILRPLLRYNRADIEAYARTHQLKWIEDPSNGETNFDRNYLRHEVMPQLTARWPSVTTTLGRSAKHCAEASELMVDLAKHDAETVVDKTSDTLCLSALLKLSPARQANLMRWFLSQKRLAVPSTAVLEQLLAQLRDSADDAQPQVSWADVVARRFEDRVYLDRQTAYLLNAMNLKGTAPKVLDEARTIVWRQADNGLSQTIVDAGLKLRYRQGGEKIHLHGHANRKTLKHCFQEWRVPVWLRESVPLLFDGDTLVAVVGYAVAEGYVNTDGNQGWWPSVIMKEAKTF
jgi:tRNA(Ile)-lysidine synthase